MSPRKPSNNDNSPDSATAADDGVGKPPGDSVELGEDVLGRNAAERNARRNALKSMLEASEARIQRARRSSKPVLAIGYQIRIRKGDNSGRIGTILDADYINNRVLVETDKDQAASWLAFDHVESVPDDT